jgi:Na+/H+ antiporter NhaC
MLKLLLLLFFFSFFFFFFLILQLSYNIDVALHYYCEIVVKKIKNKNSSIGFYIE